MGTEAAASNTSPQQPGAKQKFPAHPADHRFFSTMAVVCSLGILTGFAARYIPHLGTGALSPVIHLHAAVFTGWLLLFIAQTTLVRVGRTDLHRRLGMASVAFAALMLGVGFAAALSVARTGHKGIPGAEFPDASGFLLLNLVAVGVFFTLFVAGWAF